MRWLWYAPAVTVWICLLGVAYVNARAGQWWSAGCWLIWAALYTWQRVQMRVEYRRGWRAGFGEAAEAPGEVARGRVPAFALRAQTRGDAVPEPWDAVLSPQVSSAIITRRRAEGDD
jgi:hypothetical protein